MFPGTVPTIPQRLYPSMGPVLVPCKMNLESGKFEPLVSLKDMFPYLTSLPDTKEEPTSPCKKELKDVRWSQEEDETILNHVNCQGTQAWAKISRVLNETYHRGESVRLGKHCRERWYNHLNPELKSTCYLEGGWKDEEDERLLTLHEHWMSCWSKIARDMPGRTENNVKNRWHSLIRKAKVDLNLPDASADIVSRQMLTILQAKIALNHG